MKWGFVERAPTIWMCVLVLLAGVLAACGNSMGSPAPETDASTDAGGTSFAGEEASFDASLPQGQVVSTVDAGASDDATDDEPDAYVLEEGSVNTCGKFFECLQDCPPEYNSCMQPCHDAMTPQAADLARRFISCVQQNSCRNPDCMLRECGAQMQACFDQPEPEPA